VIIPQVPAAQTPGVADHVLIALTALVPLPPPGWPRPPDSRVRAARAGLWVPE